MYGQCRTRNGLARVAVVLCNKLCILWRPMQRTRRSMNAPHSIIYIYFFVLCMLRIYLFEMRQQALRIFYYVACQYLALATSTRACVYSKINAQTRRHRIERFILLLYTHQSLHIHPIGATRLGNAQNLYCVLYRLWQSCFCGWHITSVQQAARQSNVIN